LSSSKSTSECDADKPCLRFASSFFEISDPRLISAPQFITTQDDNYLKFSSLVIDTFQISESERFWGFNRGFYSAPFNGSTISFPDFVPNASNFTAFRPTLQATLTYVQCIRCFLQSLRFVAVGLSEVVAVVATPRSQPSCFVPSDLKAPAGTYSVSSDSLQPPSPTLVNGDFESPALSETQTYQNFASGQQLGGWLVSTITASCFHQTNKSLAFPENPQCFVSLERNFIRRSTTWDTVPNGACSIRNRFGVKPLFFLLICP